MMNAISRDSLDWASKGTPTANVPTPLGNPSAAAPPVVARYKASFQSIDNGRSSLFFMLLAGEWAMAMTRVPSRMRETMTAWRIAFMMSIEYPPAISVPSPTGTPASRASRKRKGSAEKYALESGQWAIAAPVFVRFERSDGERNVQWA